MEGLDSIYMTAVEALGKNAHEYRYGNMTEEDDQKCSRKSKSEPDNAGKMKPGKERMSKVRSSWWLALAGV